MLYLILFFGGSEIIEHSLLGRTNEPVIHLLHLARAVLSFIFVATMIALVLSRAEKNFRARMESICSLLNVANQGLIALDCAGTVVSLNQRATQILGSIYSRDFQNWSSQIQQSLRQKPEVETLDPTGLRKLRVTSLQSQDSGSLLLLQDVTKEKKMEDQWLIAEKLASVGRMAAGLAHEIGTPLNIISGRAELLQTIQGTDCSKCDSKPVCSVDKHIRVIFQQIDRISGIIQQLLVQAREPRSQRSYFQPDSSISAVVDLMKPCMEKRNIELVTEIQKDLPSIYGFPDQLQQVLINLLSNASDAINGKGGHIGISAEKVQGDLELSIEDNGAGITQENLTKIFDPFFTTKEFGKGTGLGLTVTANIIRSHGGQIEVTSELQKGTRFTIRLPVAQLPQLPAAIHEMSIHG
jgi:signal transduction histidine kinase